MARAASAAEVMSGITAAALDTADLRPDPPQDLGGGATQVVYRTPDDGVHRTAWLRVLPAARRRARRAADGARAATPRASRRSCSTSWPTRSPRRADHHAGIHLSIADCSAAALISRPSSGCRAMTDPRRARPPPPSPQATGVAAHDVAVVLGSGWRPAADVIGAARARARDGRPARASSGPPSPGTAARSARCPSATANVLVLLGRTHLYEGHGVDAVAHGVRTAAAAGCRTVVLTNAAGGIREGMAVGDPVADRRPPQPHRPLAAARPAVHRPHRPLLPPPARAGPRDRPDAHRGRLRRAARARTSRRPPRSGCCAVLGADLVGMSTVLEAIAARAEGVEVFGLSLVTNLAAGLTGRRSTTRRCSPPGRPRPRGWARCCASWSPGS